MPGPLPDPSPDRPAKQDATEMKPIAKATKCDLCIEQIGGPSCQRACPHSALRRMNLNDIDSFAEWLRR